MEEDDKRNPKFDEKYKDVDSERLPLGECLEDTYKRVLEYWNEEIEPNVRKGKNVLVACHGSTLRAVIGHFEKLSEDEISECNVPCGIPLVFEFDDDMNFVEKHYLGDEEFVQKCIEEVASQHLEK